VSDIERLTLLRHERHFLERVREDRIRERRDAEERLARANAAVLEVERLLAAVRDEHARQGRWPMRRTA
jgi:hypothetical protein